MVKIYSLNDPDTLQIRYIGKTVNSLKKRLSGHITWAKYPRNKTHIANWVRFLLKENKRPIICLIEEVSDDLWIEREQYWIAFYKDIICNHSIGGEPGGVGYICTQIHKDKISSSLLGRKRSKEECENISKGKKGMIVKESTKEKLRQYNLGKKQSLECRIKKSKFPVLQINSKTDEILAEYPTLGFAQEITGFLKGNIVSVISGRLKTYKGFKWRYKIPEMIDKYNEGE